MIWIRTEKWGRNIQAAAYNDPHTVFVHGRNMDKNMVKNKSSKRILVWNPNLESSLFWLTATLKPWEAARSSFFILISLKKARIFFSQNSFSALRRRELTLKMCEKIGGLCKICNLNYWITLLFTRLLKQRLLKHYFVNTNFVRFGIDLWK